MRIFSAAHLEAARVSTDPVVVAALTQLKTAAAVAVMPSAPVPTIWYSPGAYQDPDGANAAMAILIGYCDDAFLRGLLSAVLLQSAPTAERIVRAWTTINKGVSTYVGPKGNDSYLSLCTEGCGLVMAADLIDGQPDWSPQDKANAARWMRTVGIPVAQNILGPQGKKDNWASWALQMWALCAVYLNDTAVQASLAVMLDAHITASINATTGHLPLEDLRGARAVEYTYFSLLPMTGAAWVLKQGGGPDLLTSRKGLLTLALDSLLGRLVPLEAGQDLAWNNAAELYAAMGTLYANPKYSAYAAKYAPVMRVGQHLTPFTCPTVTLAPLPAAVSAPTPIVPSAPAIVPPPAPIVSPTPAIIPMPTRRIAHRRAQDSVLALDVQPPPVQPPPLPPTGYLLPATGYATQIDTGHMTTIPASLQMASPLAKLAWGETSANLVVSPLGRGLRLNYLTDLWGGYSPVRFGWPIKQPGKGGYNQRELIAFSKGFVFPPDHGIKLWEPRTMQPGNVAGAFENHGIMTWAEPAIGCPAVFLQGPNNHYRNVLSQVVADLADGLQHLLDVLFEAESTTGAGDGKCTIAVDKQIVAHYTDILWLAPGNVVGWPYLLCDPTFGGAVQSFHPPANQWREMDEVFVATQIA